jgi:hypothetical protein
MPYLIEMNENPNEFMSKKEKPNRMTDEKIPILMFDSINSEQLN